MRLAYETGIRERSGYYLVEWTDLAKDEHFQGSEFL